MLLFSIFAVEWGKIYFTQKISTELSYNMFVKRKDVLECQMHRKSVALKILAVQAGLRPAFHLVPAGGGIFHMDVLTSATMNVC